MIVTLLSTETTQESGAETTNSAALPYVIKRALAEALGMVHKGRHPRI